MNSCAKMESTFLKNAYKKLSENDDSIVIVISFYSKFIVKHSKCFPILHTLKFESISVNVFEPYHTTKIKEKLRSIKRPKWLPLTKDSLEIKFRIHFFNRKKIFFRNRFHIILFNLLQHH